MYLLITRNNPYFGELNKNPQSEGFQNDLDNIEIDLKSKEKRNEEAPNNEDNTSQITENSIAEEKNSNNFEDDSSSVKLKNDALQADAPAAETSLIRKKKIKAYKFSIHALNIISSIILIGLAILSVVENDKYNHHNKYARNVGSIIVSAIHAKEKNHTWEYIFNEERLNLYDLIDNNCEKVSSLCLNFEGSQHRISNQEFLKMHGFTKDTFNYENGMKNYKHIEIPLEIPDNCKTYRIALLIGALFCAFCLIAIKYLLYQFEDIFIKEKNNPFYKSEYFVHLIFELILVIIVQYPGVNSITFYVQSENVVILPVSSILSSLSIFKLLYFLRILSSLSVYDSAEVDDIFEKYSSRPSFFFTFKAMQCRFPFTNIFMLFFLSLFTLSFFMRVYEIHYWEGQIERTEDWDYQINPMWVVFSSMLTIGYGDLYPRTHFGRVVLIVACFLGIYFIAMTMIYMTKKTVLSECEQKSYKLITRIKIRNQLKDINALMIHNFLLMVVLKKKFDKRKLKEKDYLVKYNFYRRTILGIIDVSKDLNEKLKSFDFIPTKEQLHDISERIEFDIKEIKSFIDCLQAKNDYLKQYVLAQRNLMRYLRKSILNTKFVFDLIEKKPAMFGTLGKINKNEMLDEVLKEYENNRNLSNTIRKDLLFDKFYYASRYKKKNHYEQNDQLNESNAGFRVKSLKTGNFDQKLNTSRSKKALKKGSHVYNEGFKLKNIEEYFAEELAKYQVAEDIFKNHFQSLFLCPDTKERMSNKQTGYHKMRKVMEEMERLKNESGDINRKDDESNFM